LIVLIAKLIFLGGFFYHSSCAIPGIAGIIEVSSIAYPDPTQFDPESHYFDPRSSKDAPRWWHIDVRLIQKTPFLPLSDIRKIAELSQMQLLQKGNRLSITPVSEHEWHTLIPLLDLH
jgi:predicted RNA-binding protein with PUA-like domain